MEDIFDLVKNVESVYSSDTSFQVLKDFERVLDQLDLYVYKNWEDGELLEGPKITRHFVTCKFMWDRANMPDPMGGKRLSEYDCKIGYSKTSLIVPRKINKPDDIRPGSKKGKLDRKPIWVVTIEMPKKLIADIYGAYADEKQLNTEPAVMPETNGDEEQQADVLATPAVDPAAAPAGDPLANELAGTV